MQLRSKDRERLLAIFSAVNLPFEVWAYGSRVSGEAHEGSDLDLVIRTKDLQKFPIDVYVILQDKIQESSIPIVVELFDWTRLPESFHANIEANHEVLFSNLDEEVSFRMGRSSNQ
ncbi:MAG: nucleotidyltransferase domain-containing protein [Bacteroidetes bacterium]|nr:nucleotidyltransferase domain-containing protein [Bacteroidota bacterium]